MAYAQPGDPVVRRGVPGRRQRHTELPPLLAAGVLLALLPLYLGGDSAFLAFLVNVLTFAVVAVSLQLVLGHAGLLSLGHAAFFGVGAYGSALMMIDLEVSFVPAALAGTAIAAVGALVMAPIIRLSPVYFAMASFAFGIVVSEVLNQWNSVTGGHNGLVGVPPVAIGGFEALSPTQYYFLALGLLAVVYLAIRCLIRSPVGDALAAIRQSELGARGLGLRVALYKTIALVVAAAAAGAAGALYASYAVTITPSAFDWKRSIAFLAMVVVGGRRDPWGALLGAFVIQYLISYGAGIADYQVLIYGVVLTGSMLLMPNGLAGLARGGLEWVSSRATGRWGRSHA
jgi:branched-chain amino acid transport system permease protein